MFADHRGDSRAARESGRSLAREQEGAIAVMLALMLAALLGVVALAFDLGRAWNLDTELQHAADAAALAGATQLDGSDGARTRAIQAASGALIQNTQTFASDGAGAQVTFHNDPDPAANTDITFYKSIDVDPWEDATTDADAHYIEVIAQPRTVNFSFAAATGAVSSASPTARAVAFAGAAFCQVPPIFTCAPEDPPGTAQKLTAADIGLGVWMKGKDQPGATSLFPGNFGLLCLVDEDGTKICKAQDISDAIARVNPTEVCFAANEELTTKTGEVTGPIQNGVNMRFGIYPNGNFKVPDGEPPVESNPQYGPSMSPIKGTTQIGAPSCKENAFDLPLDANQYPGPLDPATGNPWLGTEQRIADIDKMTLPRDNCTYAPPYGDASCRPGVADGGRFGIDGSWDVATYMQVNHGLDNWPANMGFFADELGGNPTPTRYEVHQAELAAPPPSQLVPDTAGQSTEIIPACGLPVAVPERRIIPIVVTDCSDIGGGQQQITILQIVELFLTEAVGFGPEKDNKNIYGEVVGVTDAGPLTNVARHVIVLVE
jgi:Flp pilus assembly protein TadG